MQHRSFFKTELNSFIFLAAEPLEKRQFNEPDYPEGKKTKGKIIKDNFQSMFQAVQHVQFSNDLHESKEQ